MLSYGVIVSGELRAWELSCIRELHQSRLAQLRCIVTLPHRAAARDGRKGILARFKSQARTPLEELGAMETENPIRIDASSGDADARVRALDLDFLLLFGEKAAALRFSTSARYGVWYFAHSDISKFSTSAPCFWEIFYDHDVTGAMLLKLGAPDEAGTVLKSGYFPTQRSSLERNAETVFGSLPKWPVHVCWDITHDAASYFADAAIPLPPDHYGTPQPIDVASVRLIEKKTRIADYLRLNCFTIEWNVGRIANPASAFIGRETAPPVSFLFRRDGARFFADPCVFVRESRAYVFCEEYRHANNRGLLVTSEISAYGATAPCPIIEEPHHLSYPYVFEHDGEVYCIPESVDIRKICLYRAVEFPHRWEYVHTLIDDFAAADSTLLRHDGKWWLFCTSNELAAKGFYSHLYLWHADDLRGPWTPHARNPVKIDARSSRPAGRFFTHEDALYRPAQDCSRKYGGAITINRIETLTDTNFKETVVGTIRPPRTGYNRGIHTISDAGDWCIVDAQRYAFSLKNTFGIAKQAIKAVAVKAGLPEEALRAMKRRLQRRGQSAMPTPQNSNAE